MKSSIATGIVLAAALLLPARPARAELWTDDAMARETSPCALGRVGRLEATTRTCLSCHDGLTASGVEYATGRGGHGSHPVDVDYGQAAMRPRARFRPQASLPASVVLPGGRVTCTSCHDGASSEKSHTAMPMDRSRLCLSCHDV